MTGTGTKTDPYIIQTVDDLYAMEELGGSGVCCRLDTDIDLNDTPYAEHFVPIPVNWSSFDGNGHKIRNIYNADPMNFVSAFKVMVEGTINISGLMLENVVLVGSVVTLFMASTGIIATIELYDCTFILNITHTCKAVVNDRCILHDSNLTVSSELSVIAVSGFFNNRYALFKGGDIKRTQIILEVVLHGSSDSSMYEGAYFREVNASDSWITGSVCCDAPGSENILYMADSDCSFSNCYQAVAMDGISKVYWSNSFVSTCFYDNDLMAGAEYDSAGSLSSIFYGLTTEQCKDPDYLASIGFVCRGESDNV